MEETINNVIPAEVKYIQWYDEFKSHIDDNSEMPDKMVAMLVRFLEQNNGKLSKRATTKEFKALTEREIEDIENRYREIFTEE